MNNACILILIKIKQFSNIFIKYKSHRWAQEVRPIEQGQRSLPTACPLETSQSRAGGKRRTTGTGSGPVSPPPWPCLTLPAPNQHAFRCPAPPTPSPRHGAPCRCGCSITYPNNHCAAFGFFATCVSSF
jgi:hypothetical protein